MAWLPGWAKRVQIIIDHTKIDSDLTNFPILLYLNQVCIFNELGGNANRFKIAITAANGTTEYYAEIEKWDHANQKAWLHTKIASISSTIDTTIYFYYDSGHDDNDDYVADTQDYWGVSVNVWPYGFQTVFHMHNSPTGPILDSTENQNNGLSGGGMTADDLIDGQVGGAIDFDGNDDRIGLDGVLYLEEFSIQLLGKITSFADGPGICGDSINYFNGRLALTSSTNLRWRSVDNLLLTEAIPLDTYFLLTITRDASNNIKIYKNATDITDGTPNFTEQIMVRRIGDNPDNAAQKAWYGLIDEFRIADICFSVAWIKATYHSLFNTLVTFGAEEIKILSPNLIQSHVIPQNPYLIPLTVNIPSIKLKIWPQKPISIGTINPAILRVARTSYIFVLTGTPNITIPISSFQCSLRSIPASGIFSTWISGIIPAHGSFIIPTFEKETGFYYRCNKHIGGIWLLDTPTGSIEPDWPVIPPEYSATNAYWRYSKVEDGLPPHEYFLWHIEGIIGICYLKNITVVIPDFSWGNAIAARSTGRMEIYRRYRFGDNTEHLEKIVDAVLEKIVNEQPGAITLYGYEKAQNKDPKSITLLNPIYRSLDNGKRKFRCEVNLFLRLGDTVLINSEILTVGEINYEISTNQESMEIVES